MCELDCRECGITNQLMRELIAARLRADQLERELAHAVVFGRSHLDALDACLKSLAVSMTRPACT